MARSVKEKNHLECNKRARAKYDAAHYASMTVKFKKEELEMLNKYCEENDIHKNTLIRNLVMECIKDSSN